MEIHRCRFVDYTPHTITASAFSHASTDKTAPFDLRLAVGRGNGDIEIYNPSSNFCVESTLYGAKNRSVEGLAWALWDDVPRLFSIGGSTIVTEWDLSTGLPLKNHHCNAGVIWSISVNPSNNKLAIGCDDGSVVVLDISGGPGVVEHETILQRQNSRILSLCWYGDSLLAGGCADGKIRIWSYGENGRIVSTLKVDKSKKESTLVWCVLALPQIHQIVTGDSTGAVKFWDMDGFTLIQTLSVHSADVLCLGTNFSNETVFTGGVDRKIFNFNLIKNEKSSTWVNSCNRLMHSNDIRTLACFTSKNKEWLISGGVEKFLCSQSVSKFQESSYKKLDIRMPLAQKNVVFNTAKKLVVMWHDQTVKIWMLSGDLVCKLSLSDEENITSCAISSDGNSLAVARLTSIKIFHLEEAVNEEGRALFKVSKSTSVDQGAKLVKFSHSDLLFISPDNKVCTMDTEYDSVPQTKHKSRLPYLDNIVDFVVTPKWVVVVRLNGSIERVSSTETSRICTLSSSVSSINYCSLRNSVIVTTLENKVCEILLEGDGIFSRWSERNSEFLPRDLIKQSAVIDAFVQGEKVYLYGGGWLGCVDLNAEVPKREKLAMAQAASKAKKRSRGLEDDALRSLDQVEMNRLENEVDDITACDPIFQMTQKYTCVMFACSVNDTEAVVVERPSHQMPSPPAFSLNKLAI